MLHRVVVLVIFDGVRCILLGRIEVHAIEVAKEELGERATGAHFLASVAWELVGRRVQPIVALDL